MREDACLTQQCPENRLVLLTSGTKGILESSGGNAGFISKAFLGQSMASGEHSPQLGSRGPPLGLGARDCLSWAQCDHSHLGFFLSLKEKQDRALMTPSHPSNWLKRLRLVDPTKLSSPREPEWILSPSHPEFKASQLRNLNSVVFSLHH